MKKITVLSNSWIKIIAIITMTFDHIGVFLIQYANNTGFLGHLGLVFRVLGRIALPLFVFLAVEGALNTKSIGKYLLRLATIMIPILIFQIVAEFGFKTPFRQGNIFIDLILGVLLVWLLEQKKLSFLAVLPIAYATLSFFCFAYEKANLGTVIWWFPYFIRMQYDIFSISLFVFFYLTYKIVPFLFKERGLDPELHKNNNYYRLTLNLTAVVGLVILSTLHFVVGNYILPISNFSTYWDESTQFYAVLAGIPILLYNGKRGYNAKWFKIATYLYYPTHLIIIYLIFYIIM